MPQTWKRERNEGNVVSRQFDCRISIPVLHTLGSCDLLFSSPPSLRSPSPLPHLCMLFFLLSTEMVFPKLFLMHLFCRFPSRIQFLDGRVGNSIQFYVLQRCFIIPSLKKKKKRKAGFVHLNVKRNLVTDKCLKFKFSKFPPAPTGCVAMRLDKTENLSLIGNRI